MQAPEAEPAAAAAAAAVVAVVVDTVVAADAVDIAAQVGLAAAASRTVA